MASKKRPLPLDVRILNYMRKVNDWKNIQMIAQALKLNWNTVSKYVLVLEAKKKLECKSMGKYKIYKIKVKG